MKHTHIAEQLTTIMIADDHPIFCAGIRALAETEREFRVVGEARDGADAVELAVRLRPDLALIDLAMPRMTGFDVLRELNRRALGTRVIVLTASISRHQIVETLQLGGRGVIMKEAATDLLFRAIRSVMDGHYWVGRESVTDLVRYLQRASSTGDGRPYRLTRREQQVVAAIVSGLSNRDIARRFAVTEDTIKHHLSSVFDKVGVSNRLELALFALEQKIVDPNLAV